MDDFDFLAMVFFGSILGFALLYWAVRALAAWVDRNSPMTREDRRQLRSVSGGKRAMAGFKSRAAR